MYYIYLFIYIIYIYIFDCLNVKSLEKHKEKTKPFLKQYINENDKRFSWMTIFGTLPPLLKEGEG